MIILVILIIKIGLMLSKRSSVNLYCFFCSTLILPIIQENEAVRRRLEKMCLDNPPVDWDSLLEWTILPLGSRSFSAQYLLYYNGHRPHSLGPELHFLLAQIQSIQLIISIIFKIIHCIIFNNPLYSWRTTARNS